MNSLKKFNCIINGHEFKKSQFKNPFRVPVLNHVTLRYEKKDYYGFLHQGEFSKCENCDHVTTDINILSKLEKIYPD